MIESQRQMGITAIALARFQQRFGHLPDRLDLLTPEFLPTPTFDPFSGGPLHYHPKAGANFVLYSVGQNGQDDNGSAGRGLDGPDVVWPQSVE